MSWWRKKQEIDETQDDILDLDTVVWRGIDPMERLSRLAASAQREEDINEGKLPEPTKNNYVPTKPLPTVPLPVQHINRFVEETEADQDVLDTPDDTDFSDEIPQRALSAEEEMIEADIREQIMAEIAAEIEAELEQDNLDPSGDAKPEVNIEPEAREQQPVTPDVSDAIKTIVADEIGGWLNHNVQRIIAESVTETLSAAKESPITEQAPEQKTKAKTVKAKAPSKKAISKKAAAKKSGAKKTAKKGTKTAKAKKSSKSS